MHGMNGATTSFPIIESGYVEGEIEPKRRLKASALKAILERQEYRCALTGLELTPESANVDHVTPLSRGGKHDPSNCQIVLDHVNKAKGGMTQQEFIDMCCYVALHSGRVVLSDE